MIAAIAMTVAATCLVTATAIEGDGSLVAAWLERERPLAGRDQVDQFGVVVGRGADVHF